MIKRKGIALPIILFLLFCLAVYAATLSFSRKESKRQNLTNVHFLKANFLAQSAVQMALLKLKLFSQDLSDAGLFSLGYCPFRGIIANKQYTPLQNKPEVCERPLAFFASDCTDSSFAWLLNGGGTAENADGTTNGDYSFCIKNLKVVSAFTDIATRELVLTVQITALGTAKTRKGAQSGTSSIRTEEMVKTVILRRKLNNG